MAAPNFGVSFDPAARQLFAGELPSQPQDSKVLAPSLLTRPVGAGSSDLGPIAAASRLMANCRSLAIEPDRCNANVTSELGQVRPS